MVFDSHRSIKTGLNFLREKALSNADQYKLCISPYTDIFGVPLSSSGRSTTGGAGTSSSANNDYCVCPECQQTTAACRFAPHLEKCMGMGRNSSRVARRRLAATCGSSSSLNSLGMVQLHLLLRYYYITLCMP